MNKQITNAVEQMIETAHKMELPTEAKDLALDGLAKTRDAQTKLTGLLKDGLKNGEGLAVKAGAAIRAIGDTVLENTEANTQAAYRNAIEVLGCKDLGEAAKFQTEFARQQFTALTEQQAELFDLSTRVFKEMVEAANNVAAATAEQIKTIT